MSKSSQIFSGIALLLLVMVGLYFWYRTSVPTQVEIDAAAVQVEKIDSNVLQSKSAKDVMSMDTNGQIPLEVKPEDVGKSNPFSE